METEITFILNNEVIHIKINPAIVLLDFIRQNKRLTGTKEVCKEGDCGACAVLLGEYRNGTVKYKTINSCLYPIQKVNGKHIVTIEGLNQQKLNPIQESFAAQGASQCGFCTPGFIVSFTCYLLNSNKFDEDEAINAIAGNICRCTGYQSIKRSLRQVISNNENISFDLLIQKKIIPKYFKEITEKIVNLTVDIKTPIDKNNEIQYISGGTDLFVQKPDELLNTDTRFIENTIKPYLHIANNRIVISGSTTIEEFYKYIEANVTNLKLEKLFKLFAS